MVAKEQESINDHHLQDFDHEAEDTLSLCDLVLQSSNWNNNNNGFYDNQIPSDDDDDRDLFEFFTGDFTASSESAYPKDSIIFCGKLIQFKEGEEEAEAEAEAASVLHQEQTQKQKIVFKRNRIFPWKSNSLNMSRSTSSTKAKQQDKSGYKYKSLSQRKEYFVKPRWYLLAFGQGRFPCSEMKLRDIKNRQSRRWNPARMFGSDGGGGGGMVKRSEKRSPWKGFWTLLKVLGCKSQQASSAVKASFECIRHM